jgi:stage V sporulation protein SpoVS
MLETDADQAAAAGLLNMALKDLALVSIYVRRKGWDFTAGIRAVNIGSF